MPEEKLSLKINSRPTESISISIPTDTLDSLRKVAGCRDMSLESLLKFYIGSGLRQDLSKLFSEHLLDSTAKVLARHIRSEAEISNIIREIKEEGAI